ncbi:mfs hexose transporter [Trichoderma arundinaceum]|uniref:Mfs hexose transporter n=1 Tax=Trichoderma arundinaceum TaxID=490622 RepID=A0A395NW88_TRIAR|nr:mfs hexose transporter [Trichoderma arundinaceum]
MKQVAIVRCARKHSLKNSHASGTTTTVDPNSSLTQIYLAGDLALQRSASLGWFSEDIWDASLGDQSINPLLHPSSEEPSVTENGIFIVTLWDLSGPSLFEHRTLPRSNQSPLGRRNRNLVWRLVIVEFFATSLNIYLGGKVVIGIGSSLIQMGAPVIIMELSHPKEQSPRWLISKHEMERAENVLIKFHGEGNLDSELVAFEYEEIKKAPIKEREQNITWKAFFSSIPNLKRIDLCFTTALFSQTSDNLLISKYLTQILRDTGIKADKDVILVNGIITLWQYIIALAVTLLFNKYMQRMLFIVGSGGVLVTFIMWTIAMQRYLEKNSLTAGRLVLASISIFQAFYTIAWANLFVIYPLEVITISYLWWVCESHWAREYRLKILPLLLHVGNHLPHCVLFLYGDVGPTLEELANLFEADTAKTNTFETREMDEGQTCAIAAAADNSEKQLSANNSN